MKYFATILFFLLMAVNTVFGQIQSGNNPNFIPSEQAPMGFPTDYGYGNRVISRWITPQFETINQTTKMGLAAYHFSDIAKVEFFLNGGPAHTVYNKTKHNNINAYWVDVGPLADAEKNTLTAIVYPNSGTPFIMGRGTIKDQPSFVQQDTLRNATWTFYQRGVEPLQFASDFNNSLRKVNVYCAPWGNDSNPGTEALPKRTLYSAMLAGKDNASPANVDGVTIYLYEGDYAYAAQFWSGYHGNRYRYLTVKNHPSNINRARIASYGNSAGFRTNKVKLEGLIIQNATGPTTDSLITTTSAPMAWGETGLALYLKDCWVDNYNKSVNQPVGMLSSGWHYLATVDCTFTNMWNACAGAPSINCHLENIESEALWGGIASFNCTFKNHDGTTSDAHPDICQWYSGFEPNVTSGKTNTIVYGYRPLDRFDPAGSQGFFGQGAVDVAVDNTVIQIGKIGNYDSWATYLRTISITESYNVMFRNSNLGGTWHGISKFPGMGEDTALLQNVKRIRWNPYTQDPVSYSGQVGGRWLLAYHDEEYTAAGFPDDYVSVGTDYDVTGMYGGISEPRLGPVGVRYQFDWTDPDISYNAKDLGSVLANWNGIGVGAEGDYNKDGYVNAEDLSYIFARWN